MAMTKYQCDVLYDAVLEISDMIYLLEPDKDSPQFRLMERLEIALAYYREEVEGKND